MIIRHLDFLARRLGSALRTGGLDGLGLANREWATLRESLQWEERFLGGPRLECHQVGSNVVVLEVDRVTLKSEVVASAAVEVR